MKIIIGVGRFLILGGGGGGDTYNNVGRRGKTFS